MMVLRPDLAILDHPVFFAAGGESLFGVLSTPAAPSVLPTVILLGGGGTTPTATGRNQLFVTFSRRLARLGYPAFRFDYHGVGDSTGSSEFRLNRPFIRDVEGAVARLREFGLSEFILVGMCFGARTALSVGPTLYGLRGLALLAPPVRDYALSERRTSGWRLGDYARAAVDPRRLLGPRDKLTARRYMRFLMAGARVALRRIRTGFGGKREVSWISQRFSSPLLSLADAKVPMLLLYGTEDEEYQDFLEAERAGFDNVLAGCPTIMASALPGQVHGFTRVESQTRTTDTVLDWIQALTSTDRSL